MASYGEPWRTIRSHIASIVLHFVGSIYRHSRQPVQSNPDQALPWTKPARVIRRLSEQIEIINEDEIMLTVASEEGKDFRKDSKVKMRKVSLLTHAKSASEFTAHDKEERPPQLRAHSQEIHQSSSDTLKAASNNTLLYSVAKQSMTKSDNLAHSLHETRCIIIDTLRKHGHKMT